NQAVNQCYGVVGMANKNLANGIANLLSRDSKRGIDVAIENGEITIDVYVIVEYGVRIRAVAESIQHTVKFHVEKALGMAVREVNVFVQGLRMGKENS
ncbi:MAG: Asp23/Gls24 family envelope stress response protein, partial [Anaerolineales bacterium]|nr:Asp23/Gls24 family envelope stress response protein [Anaerolineales bacterium]